MQNVKNSAGAGRGVSTQKTAKDCAITPGSSFVNVQNQRIDGTLIQDKLMILCTAKPSVTSKCTDSTTVSRGCTESEYLIV